MKTTKKKKRGFVIYLLILILIIIANFFISNTIDVKQELTINANIDSTWQVMGTQFSDIYLWSTFFIKSEAGGQKKFKEIDYSSRVTLTANGENTQVLDVFDSESHSLSYHITKGKPGIAKQASAVWSLVDLGENKTKAVLEFKMVTKGWMGLFMSGKIKSKVNSTANEIVRDLKYYLEEKKPHPNNLNK